MLDADILKLLQNPWTLTWAGFVFQVDRQVLTRRLYNLNCLVDHEAAIRNGAVNRDSQSLVVCVML